MQGDLQIVYPENTAQPSQEQTPDEAAASLAFATQLSEGMMVPEETAEETEGEPEQQEEQPQPEEPSGYQVTDEELNSRIEERVTAVVQRELSLLKDELKTMLNEE